MVDKATATTDVQDLLANRELRPFPAVASQILAACENESVGPKDLSTIIQCDPAVALRVIRVANSSMYGFSSEILSVDHAIVAMGMRSVKNLAVSAAAADVFSGGDSAQAARSQLWQHSLACAAIAGRIAPQFSVAAEEAFLAGMVHDVGKLVFFDAIPNDYNAAIEGSDVSNIVATESDAFGTDHQTLGQECGELWGLPDEINAAIAFHHGPAETYVAEELVNVVCISNYLSRLWDFGGPKQGTPDIMRTLEEAGLELTEQELEALHSNAEQDFHSMSEACRS